MAVEGDVCRGCGRVLRMIHIRYMGLDDDHNLVEKREPSGLEWRPPTADLVLRRLVDG